MGLKITELIQARQIDFKYLAGKVIAIDASLFLYQFLTTIRQADGHPLMDSKGNVTSHLVGLFSRTTRLMNYGMRLCYVFDGKPPDLKRKEQDRRRGLKEEARAKFEQAVKKEDIESMRKYAGRTSRLTSEMIEEAKQLVAALGLPVIQAPSEAEAQAAHMVKKGDAFAVATQDADALMFGSPKIVRNLSMVGRRKKVNKLSYQAVKPELIDLSETLNELGIDNDQLIALSILVGTDYNLGGIKGIGQKGALKLVKEHKKDWKSLFNAVEWDKHYPKLSWETVFYTVKKIPVDEGYGLEWGTVDEQRLNELLVTQHDFSGERVSKSIAKLVKEKQSKSQTGLGDFL
jgi:flap endonuclease-1